MKRNWYSFNTSYISIVFRESFSYQSGQLGELARVTLMFGEQCNKMVKFFAIDENSDQVVKNEKEESQYFYSVAPFFSTGKLQIRTYIYLLIRR